MVFAGSNTSQSSPGSLLASHFRKIHISLFADLYQGRGHCPMMEGYGRDATELDGGEPA
jgi:hypothetical protein